MASKKTSITIHLVAEKSAFEERLEKVLDESFRLKRVTNKAWLAGAFSGLSCGLYIICSPIPENEAPALLDKIEDFARHTPILILVDKKDIAFGVAALERGAVQYIKMPLSDKELAMVVKTVSREDEEPQEDDERLDQLIGSSPAMRSLFAHIRRTAENPIPVLIAGETGTGKDLVAQAIHNLGPQAKENYIPVNLGAIPKQLVANELFGHEKGAFTGARQKHHGVFEQAGTGTVFLDEIDSIDQKVQVSLLRLLEQKRFKRLGGKRFLKSEARVITATNNDLLKLVEEGRFREDLFYRLDVFRINVPPLRKRKEDIPQLARFFLKQFNRTATRPVQNFDTSCLQKLQNYDWPGNVRELKNVVQRAALVCEGDTLQTAHLPARFQKSMPARSELRIKMGTSLNDVEKKMVERALQLTDNNRTEAAKMLGISRRALYNKLKKHGLL